MKKQLLGLITILTILNACQKNEVSVSLPEEVTIYATIEDKNATKTIMDESNNILWTENDQIIAFMKSSYGHKYQVKPSFVGKSYADFSMVSSNNGSDLSAGNEWEHNVVYYPYSEDIKCLKSGVNYALEVNLPSEQVYVPDSFANGSMAMVAVSESNNITFKNVLGGIKLQLKGTQTVMSIKVIGKNNEKLSGAAIVTAYADGTKPTISMSSSTSTSVTLNCGTGVQLNNSNATEFILAIPPTSFSKGFNVIILDSYGNSHIIDTDKENTIFRSSILSMPIKEIVNSSQEEYPNNQIWYTSYTESIIEPYVKSGFGANIIENTYINGKGIIIFDEDITTIPTKAFYGIKNLETITLPSGIKSIRESAFENCELLTTINFSNSLQSIGDKTFYNCKNLATIKLPESLTSIGKNAFSDCRSIIELVIPNKINKIESGTFSWCNKMKHITIPNTVKSIESSAFWACQSLESIKLPDNLTYIGSSAFYACNMLENVIIPDNVLTIGDACFESCDKLSGIHVGASVTNIGNGILRYCDSLKSIEGKYASNDKRCLIKDGTLLGFAGNGITEYSISNDVKLIGSYAMAGRSDLTSITISDSVTLIEEYAFGWTNLTTVNIGKGLKAISNNAFLHSADLVSVYCNVVTPPICGSRAFYGTDSQLSIFVPTLSVEEYITAENWSEYASRIKGYEF